ncbi:MAG: MFS transporter [Rubrivivax sp.]|nr:MFS transporter [Rubrivivax sp.]
MMTRRPALAPFGTRSFRYQWPADLCTAWALEMETLILGWYVLVESGSVVQLTLFGALMFVGTLLSPLLGTLGDRVGLRRVLAGMRASYALLAGVILGLVLGGTLSPTGVLAVAFVVGLIKPSDIGLRSALVSATVPAAQLVAAMGISRTTQDSARIGGALAGAGFMASLGMATAYVVIVALYVAGVVLTLRSGRAPKGAAAAPASVTSRAAPAPQPRPASPWRDLLEGLQHVWHTPRLRAAMALAALVNLCAFPLSGGLMPYIARDVFGLDQQGLGWLVASYASGALLGSLGISAFGTRLPPARTMVLACVAWFLCLLGLALPIGAPVAMALYLAAGLNQSLSMVALSIILLRTSHERFRGRVMGVRMLAIYTLPIGLLAAGPIVTAIGFRGLVLIYVGLGLSLLAAIALVWRDDLLPHAAPANALR